MRNNEQGNKKHERWGRYFDGRIIVNVEVIEPFTSKLVEGFFYCTEIIFTLLLLIN